MYHVLNYDCAAWNIDNPVNYLQVFALEKLNKIVDVFWAEISEAIDKM